MILIVDTNKRRADSIADIFYYMGIISRAVTPTAAFAEISPLYRAVIISGPNDFPDVKDFKNKLTSYSSAPIYSISNDANDARWRDLFRISFNDNAYSSSVAVRIANDLKACDLPAIGTYRLAGIDASCDLSSATALGKALPFTKTELMILRYLTVAYPTPQTPNKILKYAFKPGKMPDISGIRTHISIMNKKFRALLDRRLIITIPEQGYVIATPEILSQLNSSDA